MPEVALEPTLVSKPVVVHVGQDSAIRRGGQPGADLADTSLVESVRVIVSLCLGNEELRGAILGVEVIADIALAGKVPGRVDVLLVAASISLQTLVDIRTGGASSSVNLQLHTRRLLKVDDVEPD